MAVRAVSAHAPEQSRPLSERSRISTRQDSKKHGTDLGGEIEVFKKRGNQKKIKTTSPIQH